MKRYIYSISTCIYLLPGFYSAIAQKNQSPPIDSLRKTLLTQKDTSRVTTLLALSKAFQLKDNLTALSYANEAVTYSQEIGFKKGMMSAYLSVGFIQKLTFEYSQALDNLQNALILAEDISDWSGAGLSAYHIANVFDNLKDQNQSLTYGRKALGYLQKSTNWRLEYLVTTAIGKMHSTMFSYDSAIIYFKRALQQFKNLGDSENTAVNYLNLAESFQNQGNFELALNNYDSASLYFNKVKNSTGYIFVLNGKASVFLDQGRTSDAIELLKKTMDFNATPHLKFHLLKTLELLAMGYLKINHYTDAETILKELIETAKKFRDKQKLSDAYDLLAEVSLAQHQYKSAYEYSNLHKAYMDSIFSDDKNKQINNLLLQLERKSRQEEVSRLKQEQQLGSIYLGVAVSTGILVSIISYLIIVGQRSKAIKNRQLSHEKQKISELNEQQLKLEIDHKNKELTTFTLNLIQKNELLEGLKLQIEEIRRVVDAPARSKLSTLTSTINFSTHLDKDWDNFKTHFQDVHKDFLSNIQKNHPEMTSNDLRACALLKLNLGTKEMASILDISPESVKALRYRIRKKLNLQGDETLSSFLAKY